MTLSSSGGERPFRGNRRRPPKRAWTIPLIAGIAAVVLITAIVVAIASGVSFF